MTLESTSSLRVLVAEDEPAMLSLVARHMRSLGFSVIEASEGDAAWEMAQQHHPDLVVLDVMMPGMSGWEICKRLKGDASEGRPFAKTGVIMLTGIGENLNEMTSPLFAADAWLNKPFDFGELDSKVRETLSRYAKSVPSSSADKHSSSDDGKRASREAKGRADAAPGAKKTKAAKNGASRAGAAIASAVEQTKAAAKAVTKAVTEAVTEVASMVAPKAATKAAPKAAPKAASKPAPKAAAKPAPKAAAKPAPKAAAKPAPKVATKASAGSAKKTAEKPGLKAGSAKKTAGKPAAKTSTAKKPASRTTEKTSTQSRRAR